MLPGNVIGTYVLSICTSIRLHMWQFRVEIEHYSVAYFDRIATFEAL